MNALGRTLFLIWKITSSTIVFILVAGCNMFSSHIQTMDTMQGLALSTMEKVAQSDSFGIYQFSGQGLNPGVEGEVAIKYTFTLRYVGLSGQFGGSSAGSGEGGGISEHVWDVINRTTIADTEKINLIRELLHGRVKEKNNGGETE